MEPLTWHWLRSPAGQAALAETAQLTLSQASHLRDLAWLRQRHTAAQAAALIETVRLRRHAAGKFRLADQMYFTRAALEQASSELVAAHTAARFAGCARIADLGCGIGGDTLALARIATVIAIDRDPLRLAMAQANLAVHGLSERVRFICADLNNLAPPAVDALFIDPARRQGDRRLFRPVDFQPSFALVEQWAARTPAMGVKTAPGIADEAVPAGWEIEFIAVEEELKAAVLWHGRLAGTGRRASLLPTGHTLSREERRVPTPPLAAPSGYLIEPNPAIMRAHLIDQLAAAGDAWQIDRSIAYLCARQAIGPPLARSWPIREWFPFNLKRLNQRLHQLGVGQIVVKKRGSAIEPAMLHQRLTLAGPASAIVVLTRVAGRPAIILCQPE